jgi:hypothetical protein
MTGYYADSQAIWVQDSSPPKIVIALEVLRNLLQNVEEDFGSQIILVALTTMEVTPRRNRA